MDLSGPYERKQDRAGIPHDILVDEPGQQLSGGSVRAGIVVKGQIWTSVGGGGVKGVSPAERGRSVAEPLDAGEHHAHAAGPTMPAAAL